MSELRSTQYETSTRYAAMEKGAGSALFVLAVVAVTCTLQFQPAFWFTIGSLTAGVIVYLSWRAMLAKRQELGTAVAIAAIAVFLTAATTSFTLSLFALVATGMSQAGVGLYAAILVQRFAERKAGHND